MARDIWTWNSGGSGDLKCYFLVAHSLGPQSPHLVERDMARAGSSEHRAQSWGRKRAEK